MLTSITIGIESVLKVLLLKVPMSLMVIMFSLTKTVNRLRATSLRMATITVKIQETE